MIACHSREIENILLDYYHLKYIKIVETKMVTGRDMVWVLVGVRGCVAADVGHSLVTPLSLSVSVKDRPLHKALGKSQTYFPEHILGYGCLEGLLLSCHGSDSFRTDCQGFIFCGGGPCTALSPGLSGGGLESQFGRGLGHPGQGSDGLVLLVPRVQAGRVFFRHPAGERSLFGFGN